MAIEILKANAHLASNIQFATIKPSITGYTRLETQPTSISMKTGLQAPLGDPLWMLARQWQFNEFQGEDAGTPLKLAFNVQGTAIDRFRASLDEDQPWQTLTAGDAPIETRVEAEPVLKVHPRLRAEAGLQLLRMMPDAGVRAALLNAYRLDLAAPTDPQADIAGELWSTVFSGRTVDASLVLADLLPLLDADAKLTALPAALPLAADVTAATITALQTWYAWLQALVVEGEDNPPAWRRERLEYAFALGGGNIVLKAEQYADGHVDWEDFQAETLAGDDVPVPVTREFKVTQRHPAPVRYPGMPAERYWEFEDGRVNFAGAEAGVTDLLRLSVTEFALSFGNDWFVTPVRLPVGWMYKVNNLEITDSFGVTSTSKPVQPTGNVPWYMYEMSAAANVAQQLQHAIFVPDSLDGVTEGAVLEHTLLARDEMANLAWAIEKKVQGVSGEPLDRDMEAKALAFQQQIHFDELPDSPQLVYRLATPVPANWTPLLPVRKSNTIDFTEPFEIQLERAGMKRFYPAPTVAVIGENDPAYTAFIDTLEAQANFITPLPIDPDLRAFVFYPRGWLLRKDPLQPMVGSGDDADILRIEEEEIPRIGASLKRKFQYARGSDGKSWLWIGRSKLAGRGGAASNLRFDVAEKTHTFR